MKIDITSFGPNDFDSSKRFTPILRVGGKVGRVNFSQTAKELLGLEHGDRVKISQDNSNTSIWYVHKDKNGFEIRVTKSGKKVNTGFYSIQFARMIEEWAGKESGVSFVFKDDPIVTGGITYWPMRLANEEVEEEENEGEETPVIPIKRKRGRPSKEAQEQFQHSMNGTGGLV